MIKLIMINVKDITEKERQRQIERKEERKKQKVRTEVSK
jgi:hypothetical protein